MDRDGYYIMSVICVTLGAMLLMGFILPTVKRLQCEFLARRMESRLTISPADECLEGQDTELDKRMHPLKYPYLRLPGDANIRRLTFLGSGNITVYHLPRLSRIQLSSPFLTTWT